MSSNQSDALVFFGATGDLAYKKIFPSLQAMLKRGNLNVPVFEYEPKTWGPQEIERVTPPGGWYTPLGV
jgi:glucose-6-phosphate 1-dehydrogenase